MDEISLTLTTDDAGLTMLYALLEANEAQRELFLMEMVSMGRASQELAQAATDLVNERLGSIKRQIRDQYPRVVAEVDQIGESVKKLLGEA